MASERTGFRIKRSANRTSGRHLDVLPAFRERFPRHTGQAKVGAYMALTLVGLGEMTRPAIGDRIARLGRVGFAKSVLLPHPETHRKRLRPEVVGVDYLGNEPGVRSLVVLLADPGGVLEAEHATYTNRIDALTGMQHNWKPLKPHLTLFSLDINYCSSEVLTWTAEQMPGRVTLDSISTGPAWIMRQACS